MANRKKTTRSNNKSKKENKKIEVPPLKTFLQKNDVLIMLYPKNNVGDYSEYISQEDEIEIIDLLSNKKDFKKSLLIFLDTGGGNVYSAVKIMDSLRMKYKNIKIAIPQEAKSSGTLMCCAADKLIMGPVSELGPLDKPMTHPDNETARISALDIVRSIEGMLDMAEEREKRLAREINENYDITIKQSLRLASNSVAKLISPMLCNEDIKIYNQAKRLLGIAEKYAKEFLANHMLSYIRTDKIRNRAVGMLTRRLVWLYPDHGFAIRRDELRDWFFIVDSAEKLECWEELWNIFKNNIGSHKKIIEFVEN